MARDRAFGRVSTEELIGGACDFICNDQLGLLCRSACHITGTSNFCRQQTAITASFCCFTSRTRGTSLCLPSTWTCCGMPIRWTPVTFLLSPLSRILIYTHEMPCDLLIMRAGHTWKQDPQICSSLLSFCVYVCAIHDSHCFSISAWSAQLTRAAGQHCLVPTMSLSLLEHTISLAL